MDLFSAYNYYSAVLFIMKYLKFNHILIIFFILFSGIIFWQFFSLLSFADSSLNFEGKSQQEKFYPGSPLIQKITATENNFNQVNVALKKFSPKLGDKIILEIMDGSCNSNLAKTQLDIFSWYSPTYAKFRFPAISDSQNKTYCLKFTHILGKFKPDKKAYIPAYSLAGASYINTGKSAEEQKDRSLGLKPAYGNGSTWQNFSQLLDRMSQYKPNYFKGISLEIIFILSFILIISFAISVILV